MTSSNYDDNEEKVTGGRNGYGAKLTNIYSNKFVVETADAKNKKKYKQVFRNNMDKRGEAEISSYKDKSNYTRITFRPDFKRFNMEGLNNDICSLFTKRVYDMAGITPKSVRVYFNGDRIDVKDFKSYVDLYFKSEEIKQEELELVYEKDGDRWEV